MLELVVAVGREVEADSSLAVRVDGLALGGGGRGEMVWVETDAVAGPVLRSPVDQVRHAVLCERALSDGRD